MNTYNRYYRQLLRGSPARPRGLAVHQLHSMTYSFFPGTFVRRDKDNPAIGFVEGLQFIAGTFDVSKIQAVAPRARLDLFTGQSAYGPRVAGQWSRVFEALLDRDTRRAVIMIAHPGDSNDALPCTLSMQFQIVENNLMTIVTMRSSDAIWGLPYDQIQFGMVATAVAHAVDVLPGIVIVNIGNAHVYEITQLKKGERFTAGWEYTLPHFGQFFQYVHWAQRVLEDINSRGDVEHVFQWKNVGDQNER